MRIVVGKTKLMNN